ncbi:hypothetical protein SmJEL517_g01387 [Synchytrium microbalum]|uniref:4-hydroxy-3-methoxy-5-polyprenylbenzoate decarboxylase n=1 Tax=Synchytrium microbalum TaxID=1806994 RepID=A0A507CAN6_9FUNG|nr:uncharacterized protein SmJEL517_g01387 [Synchytrium microbalum]TPX36682.1 hypothetical protein SmJEL517_g01387 [Synchytrium microbalum]
MVAALGESTGSFMLSRMRDRMLLDSTGRKILQLQPIINTSTLPDNLSTLPPGTFGHEYLAFCTTHNVSADTRTPIKYISDPELAYVMTRYRQVHDFWHTLLGLGITVQDELAIKWFEMVQTGLPVAALSSFVGPARLSKAERDILFDVYVPWAVQTGARAKFLMNIMYEEEFERPLEDVRKDIGVWPAPI